MSISYVPKKIYLTKGVGKHREKLSSFEMALRSAGIAQYNLVRVSSIFPPHCKLISLQEGQKLLKSGQVLHVVMSENATNEPHRLVAASVGVAIPKDRNQYGYPPEHHSYGQTHNQAGGPARGSRRQRRAGRMPPSRRGSWRPPSAARARSPPRTSCAQPGSRAPTNAGRARSGSRRSRPAAPWCAPREIASPCPPGSISW